MCAPTCSSRNNLPILPSSEVSFGRLQPPEAHTFWSRASLRVANRLATLLLSGCSTTYRACHEVVTTRAKQADMPRYAVGSSRQVRVNQGNQRHLSTPRLADRKSVRENPDYALRFGNGFRNKTLRNPRNRRNPVQPTRRVDGSEPYF